VVAPPKVKHPSALQSVVSEIVLPTSGNEHGLDLDGDGMVDNQVGRLLGLLRSALQIELQPTLNKQLQAGKAIVLFDLLAGSLWTEGEAEVRAYLGRDLDSNAANNYSGVEQFQAISGIVETSVLPGSISSGRLATTKPSTGFIALPFLSKTAILPLRNTRIQAEVGPDGMQQAVLAGAIPMADAVALLAPVLTAELDRLYKLPELSPLAKQAFKSWLDADADGSISEQELTGSTAFGFLLHTADIDTDEDGTPDAVSFGIAFRSVPCSIRLSQ